LRAGHSFDYSAKFYDLLYKDKDYEREVDFLEKIFLSFGRPDSVLEVGCGTGNYTQILHRRGYNITGLDISENMIRVARQKCDCAFQVGDIRNVSMGGKFDACIAMFAVMGYMVNNSDMVKALNNIRAHLKTNGLFVFDVWNGLAVMRTLPEVRVKEVEDSKNRVLRIAYPRLEAFSHVCRVDYKLLVLDKNEGTFEEFDETHNVRFYFPQEIKFFLESAGFEVLKVCPFLDFADVVDENVWNMTIIARSGKSKQSDITLH
jgi:SAM-dependent methyltransferase